MLDLKRSAWRQPTLKELFTGILLEEGFVRNRTGQVVDHEAKNRLDFILAVTSIVCKCGVLIALDMPLIHVL